MNIIIVGCGKVGSTLAVQLSKEDNNVTVVDVDMEKVKSLSTANDIIGINGNGVNNSVLIEAGIVNADLLIVVTGSDEFNLLSCVIAQKSSKCKLIARVRNPVYESESQFLQKELGLSMIINPELLTAQEIYQVLCFPGASEVSSFSNRQAQMIRYKIRNGSVLDGKSLKSISADINGNILICVVERANVVFIPKGDDVLREGDTISILSTRKTILEMFHKIKADTNPVRNTMIIGGGKITVYLAKMLLKSGFAVKIIENDPKRCEELVDLLPQAVIINGDGSDRKLLLEERIDHMDSFVALTNFDEENIIISLFAKNEVSKKVVTKVNRFQLNEVVNNLSLESVVYPKNITTEVVLQYVRSMKNSIGSNISTLYRFYDERVEALEFKIKEKSAITDVPLRNLSLKKNILIGCITRNGRTIIPSGQEMIMLGDSIVIVTTLMGLQDAQDILE